MDYSKLSDNDLKALYNNNYSAISDDGIKMLYGGVSKPDKKGYQGIDYSDIQNNPNLSKEEKAKAIQERTKKENKRLDRENALKQAKMWGGEVLELGSMAIPPGIAAKAGLKVAQPLLKAALKNAPGLITSGAVSGIGQAMRNDADNIQDYLKSIGQNIAITYGGGKALEGAAHLGKSLINSNAVKEVVSNVLETLTSTPAEYSKRALEKELAGQSILNGKFDAKTAYQLIEQKLRDAKNMLPTNEEFAKEYYNLGKRATQGLENLKAGAGQEISEMLGNLSNTPVNMKNLRNAIDSTVKNYAKGGNINPAEIRAGKELEQVKSLIGDNATPIDLHNIKELLYDVANYDTAGGIKNDAIKGVANQINNYLRAIEPNYAKPNDVFSLIKGVEKDLGGLNQNTIGNKISNIGSEGNIVSGLDTRLKNIDNLLPGESKFYKQAQDINAEREAVNNIKNTIGKQYERNPRLLANRNDLNFEQALDDLQTRTGQNFMDELNDIRAREALEKWFPGQGGGSGSEQGFGNLLRTAIVGGSGGAAAITKNPVALSAVLGISPKFMAKGTIKNLGRLNNISEAISNAYDKVLSKYLNAEIGAVRNLSKRD